MQVLLEARGQEGADVNPSAPAVALGIAAINQAIKEGKASQTLRVLCNPDVALCGVVNACAGAYQEQLAALMATKRPAGKTLGLQNLPHPRSLGCTPGQGVQGEQHPPAAPLHPGTQGARSCPGSGTGCWMVPSTT